MKLTKTQKYILIAIGLYLAWYFFLKKDNAEVSEPDDEEDPPENVVDPGHDRMPPGEMDYGSVNQEPGEPEATVKETDPVKPAPNKPPQNVDPGYERTPPNLKRDGQKDDDPGPLGPAEKRRKNKTRLGKTYSDDAMEARKIAKEQENRQLREEQEEAEKEDIEKEKAAILKDHYQREMVEKKAHMTGRSFDQQLTATAEYYARNSWKQDRS